VKNFIFPWSHLFLNKAKPSGKNRENATKTLRSNWTQAEGFILGVSAKMITIAGPGIVYGVSASLVYGLICWIYQMMLLKKLW